MIEIAWAQKLQPYISEEQVEKAYEEFEASRDHEDYKKFRTLASQRESRLNAEKIVPIVNALFGEYKAQEISCEDGAVFFTDLSGDYGERVRIEKEDLDDVIDVLQRMRDQIKAGVILTPDNEKKAKEECLIDTEDKPVIDAEKLKIELDWYKTEAAKPKWKIPESAPVNVDILLKGNYLCNGHHYDEEISDRHEGVFIGKCLDMTRDSFGIRECSGDYNVNGVRIVAWAEIPGEG